MIVAGKHSADSEKVQPTEKESRLRLPMMKKFAPELQLKTAWTVPGWKEKIRIQSQEG